jgi:hypothetical protein
MNKVQMTHPNLPNQPIEVREDAVFHYERSGWKRADKREETSPSTVSTTPAPSESSPAKGSTRKSENVAG